LKNSIVPNSGFLHFAFSGLQSLADAMVPVSLLSLGSNLTKTLTDIITKKKNDTIVGKRVIGGIIVAKLIIMPVFGILFVYLVSIANLLPSSDPILKFVLMLEAATPTATNVGNMCQMIGYGEKEMTIVLFWQYFFGTFTLTFWVAVFLYCIQLF